MYVVTNPDGIRHMASGRVWSCGATLGGTELSEDFFAQLLKDRAIAETDVGEPQTLKDDKIVDATPTAKAIAAHENLDLNRVTGTGTRGRVVAADVRLYLREQEEGT